jgi:hypothetical protein
MEATESRVPSGWVNSQQWHLTCYSCYKPGEKSYMRKGSDRDYKKRNISVLRYKYMYLVLWRDNSYFLKPTPKFFSEADVIKMLDFLIDNIPAALAYYVYTSPLYSCYKPGEKS